MARSRNIKPGFFTNEQLAELPPLARLLFAGLWTICDRDGKLEDRPKRIKVSVLPYDNCNVDRLLKQLHEAGFISRYTAKGIRCIKIPTWNKHQNPHVKEPASQLPEPEENSSGTVPSTDENKSGPAESNTSESNTSESDSPLPAASAAGGVREPEQPELSDPGFALEPPAVNGNGNGKGKHPSPAEIAVEPYVARLHARHPAVRNCGPAEIRAKLLAIVRKLPHGQWPAVLDLIDRNHAAWCESEQWTKDGGEFAKGLDNWLSPTKERWKTGPPPAPAAAPRKGSMDGITL